MQDRYSLRFETGERKGEIVPLPSGRSTVGRRPGNTLQIADSSVSGQHAELVVDEFGGLVVRDLGSTNGTTVGGARVEGEVSAAHGDRIAFGSVQLTLLDGELEAAPTPAKAKAGAGAPGEAERVGTVRADQLAEAGRGSRAGLLFGIAALLALGGGAWMLFGRGGGGGGGLRPVRDPAGNLLSAGYSFEEDASGEWRSDEAASGSFQAHGAAKVSGALGLRADLDAGTEARLVSKEVPARQGQTLRLLAELRGRGGAGGRGGIEFLRSEPGSGGPGPLVAWGPWSAGDEGFAALELSAPAPPGTLRARAVIEARAGTDLAGTVDVDDVALLAESGAGAPAGERDDYQVFLLGEPAQAVAVYKLGRPLFGEIEVRPATAPSGPPPTVTLALEREDHHTRVRFDGLAGDALLTLRLEPAALAGEVATMGPGGHRTHGPDFEREEATGLLVGSGVELIALRFDPPVTIRSSADDGGARVRVELGARRSFVGQLDFAEERKQAGDLAHQARTAERDGELGLALNRWGELLESFPFEKALVAEAEEARGRLVTAANQGLLEAREAYERGQYFGLVEHYQRTLAAVDALAARYAGSEVEASARELAADVEAAIDALLEGRRRTEAQSLRSILAALESAQAPGLAGEVRGELAERAGDGD